MRKSRDARKKHYKVIILSIIMAASLFSILLPSAMGVPHTIYGYVYYKENEPAVNASVTALNINKKETLRNITYVSNTGFYYFDVGSPGPNWSDGDVIDITVEKFKDNKTWKGNAELTLNFSKPNQRVQDIYLSPQSPKKTPDFEIFPFLISLFFILILKKFRNNH